MPDVLHEVIKGYRQNIAERYQYERISDMYEIPESFDKERVDMFRAYFLEYIYPDAEQRDMLDDAFHSLDNYIQRPNKLLQILLESGRLIFKYGRHLPKILAAGLKALRSFRMAIHFEEQIVSAAAASGVEPPYSPQNIKDFIDTLPRKDMETFIAANESLFGVLHDRELVGKIQEIVNYLIRQMKKRPNVYSAEEVRGLELGAEIIREGNALFDSLSPGEQDLILHFVVQMESDYLFDG